MKRLLVIVSCLLAIFALAGCTAAVGGIQPTTASTSPADTPTIADTAEPATATPRPSEVPAVVSTEDLIAQVEASEPQDAFGGFAAIPLVVAPDAEPLWAVISTGMRNYDLDPLPSHFFAIYTHDETGWQQLARLDLDSEDAAPDYVDEQFSKQVDIDPSRVFFEVSGGVGAHGGTYQLLSFDGSALRIEVTLQSPSPGMGSTQDVNGDGTPDVVLDQSDPYIFCYACGARLVRFDVLTWNAQQGQFVAVTLQPLPADQPENVSALAVRAVELAQGGLWKDAYARITEARDAAGAGTIATLDWDYGIIALHAEALVATLDAQWPLIQQVFYGDYAAAVDIMRTYTPEEIWTPDSPLVTDPIVESFVDSLSTNLIQSATQALQVEPDLAAAYFIRGWGEYLADPTSAQARADVAQAASLAPDDALYAGSVAALQ